MTAIINLVGWHAVHFLWITSAIIYAGLVILGYAMEGARYQIRFNCDSIFRSAERLLVGIGVRALGLILHAASAILDPLFETSAQVGEWFTRSSSAETQARYRSRFI